MDDQSKRFLKTLAAVGILDFVLAGAILIINNELFENLISSIAISAASMNLGPLVDSINPIIMLPIINMQLISLNQQSILGDIEIVLLEGLAVSLIALELYFGSYLSHKMRKRAGRVRKKREVISAPRKPRCLFCGAEIPENIEYCPQCGRARVKCSVCHEDIFSEDRPVKCPHCGALSHREHLAEWIREKGSCPECGGKLKEIIMVGVASKSKCFFCGAEIPKNAEYCPRCGEARARCSVCNNDIVSKDLYVKCPYCGALSHREHLLEWIKVKGYCPNCRDRLKETDVA
jgi:hypothetical protein